MAHFGEGVGRRGPGPLRRRIGGGKFGVLTFQGDEFAIERIVFSVADDRRVEDVIAIEVIIDLLAEVGDAFLYIHSISQTRGRLDKLTVG